MHNLIVVTAPVVIPGAYRVHQGQRVALVEVEPGYSGAVAIREGAPGVRRIVRDYGLASVGTVIQAEALKARLEATV